MHFHSIVDSVCLVVRFGEIAKETSSGSDSFVVKNIQNVHHMKIDVVKFDGTNNFGLRRCEVMDTLNAQNLKDTLELQENRKK